jgi:hypothetical protein
MLLHFFRMEVQQQFSQRWSRLQDRDFLKKSEIKILFCNNSQIAELRLIYNVGY